MVLRRWSKAVVVCLVAAAGSLVVESSRRPAFLGPWRRPTGVGVASDSEVQAGGHHPRVQRRWGALSRDQPLRMAATTESASVGVENVVIIGSGPAGYTAAIYCGRANMRPVLFEGAATVGGQLMATSEVENFPGFPEGVLGPDLMTRMRNQALRWGAVLETDDVVKVDLSQRPFVLETATRQLKANSLIVATGATAKRLGLPSEEQFWSRGITACAVCDGAAPIFKSQPVAVVGGGDSAAEEAVYLTKYTSKVYLLVRKDKLVASKAMQDRVLRNPKVEVRFHTTVEDVYGDSTDTHSKSSPVKGLKIKSSLTGEVTDLPVRGLFYAIGHKPSTEVFKDLETDHKGYLKVKPGTVATSVEGVFAAGDVQDPHWRQAITAAGTGCMAALSAERYLTTTGLLQEVHLPPGQEEGLVEAVKEAEAKASDPGPSKASASGEFSVEDTYFKGEEAFRQLNSVTKKPIMVLFASKTCGPCRILKPILSKVLKDFEGKVHFVEVDIEESADFTAESSVAGTPTIQVYQEQELVNSLRGVKKSSVYREEIEKLVS